MTWAGRKKKVLQIDKSKFELKKAMGTKNIGFLNFNDLRMYFWKNRKRNLVLWRFILSSSRLGTIQVLRHQKGGWMGSENGNFC